MAPVTSLPSMREILAAAFRYKWPMLLTFTLPLVIGLSLPFMLTPKYEAVTRVLVRAGREFTPQADVSGSGMVSLPQTTMREMVDTVTQILTSMDLIRDVLQDETVQKLYPDLANSRKNNQPIESAAAAALAGDLTVSPVRLTNVIQIELRSTDPKVAVDALRAVLARFQERYIRAFSQKRSGLLETQISENLDKLAHLQQERADYITARNLFSLPEQRNLLVSQRVRGAQDLRQAEMQKASLQEQIRFLNDELAKQPATITLQTTNQDSAVADDAQRRLRDLREREHELLNTLGPSHPEVRGVRQAIASIQQTLAQTRTRSVAVTAGVNPLITHLRSQLATVEAEQAPLDDKIMRLRAALDADDMRLRQVSEDEIRLQGLDRSINELETAVRELRQRLTDARLSEELDRAQIAGLSVIQQPLALDKPVSPKKILFLAGGLAVGLISSIFALLTALTFGNTFLAAETVERMLGVPVLVALPPVPAWRRQGQMALSAPIEGSLRDIAAGT